MEQQKRLSYRARHARLAYEKQCPGGDETLFMSVAYCRAAWVTRHVYLTWKEAEEARAWIDEFACGGICRKNHAVEQTTLDEALAFRPHARFSLHSGPVVQPRSRMVGAAPETAPSTGTIRRLTVTDKGLIHG